MPSKTPVDLALVQKIRRARAIGITQLRPVWAFLRDEDNIDNG